MTWKVTFKSVLKAIANWRTRPLTKFSGFHTLLVTTSRLDDHQVKAEDLENVGELSETWSRIVLKWLYLARIGRPDLLWTVKLLGKTSHKVEPSVRYATGTSHQ